MRHGPIRSAAEAASLGVAILLVAAHGVAHPSPGCAATPQDAWKSSQEAAASGDAGRLMLTLSPGYRTRNSVEYAVGASMMVDLGGMSGEMSAKPGSADKAKAAATRLRAELDAILKKYKAASIQEIGTPLLVRMQAPEVVARFEKIDHAAYAREMEKFFVRVEAAAKEAGVSSEGPPKIDELVVGGGDLQSALGESKVTGDTARASAGKTTMLFRKVGGCWLIDAREDPTTH